MFLRYDNKNTSKKKRGKYYFIKIQNVGALNENIKKGTRQTTDRDKMFADLYLIRNIIPLTKLAFKK